MYILRWIDGYFKKLAKHPAYEGAVAGCKHEELLVPVEEGEGGQVPLHLSPSSSISDLNSYFSLSAHLLLLLIFSGACAGPHPSPPCREFYECGAGLRSRRSCFVRIRSPLSASSLPPRNQPWHASLQCGLQAVHLNKIMNHSESRLAPESKCPQQAIDFSSVLSHLSSNAGSFGLDPQRLAAAGESGGGWVILGCLH